MSLWVPFGLKPRREETGVRYADIYARSIAAGIDLMILFVLLNDLFHVISMSIYAHLDRSAMDRMGGAASVQEQIQLLWQAHALQLWFINGVVQMAIIAGLMLGCQCAVYTTPGKWAMGLKVVDAKTLTVPTRWQFVLRFFAYIPAMLPLMLGFIWISFNKQRRGWHDYIAGTAVIHTRPRDWVWVQIKLLWRRLRGSKPA